MQPQRRARHGINTLCCGGFAVVSLITLCSTGGPGSAGPMAGLWRTGDRPCCRASGAGVEDLGGGHGALGRTGRAPRRRQGQ